MPPTLYKERPRPTSAGTGLPNTPPPPPGSAPGATRRNLPRSPHTEAMAAAPADRRVRSRSPGSVAVVLSVAAQDPQRRRRAITDTPGSVRGVSASWTPSSPMTPRADSVGGLDGDNDDGGADEPQDVFVGPVTSAERRCVARVAARQRRRGTLPGALSLHDSCAAARIQVRAMWSGGGVGPWRSWLGQSLSLIVSPALRREPGECFAGGTQRNIGPGNRIWRGWRS